MTDNKILSLDEKLLVIQQEIKVPKTHYNDYGKFSYRTCEDILSAIKPFCKKYRVIITLYDEILTVGERYYIKAHAILTDLDSTEIKDNVAYAREEEDKKGMDGSQITGAASSYARKYALNGLLAIDDIKDSDFTNNQNGQQSNNQNIKKIKNTIQGTRFTLNDAEKWSEKHFKASVSNLEDFELKELLNALNAKIKEEKEINK